MLLALAAAGSGLVRAGDDALSPVDRLRQRDAEARWGQWRTQLGGPASNRPDPAATLDPQEPPARLQQTPSAAPLADPKPLQPPTPPRAAEIRRTLEQPARTKLPARDWTAPAAAGEVARPARRPADQLTTDAAVPAPFEPNPEPSQATVPTEPNPVPPSVRIAIPLDVRLPPQSTGAEAQTRPQAVAAVPRPFPNSVSGLPQRAAVQFAHPSPQSDPMPIPDALLLEGPPPLPRSENLFTQPQTAPAEPTLAWDAPTSVPSPATFAGMQLKNIRQIQPFSDYNPDPQRDDPCKYLCPRPEDAPCGESVANLRCPDEFELPLTGAPQRLFAHSHFYWSASNLFHNPLYFADPELERSGHTWPDYVQPFVSVGRFGTQVAGLPYQLALDPVWRREYALGLYQPGDWSPKLHYQIPLNAKAAATAAATYTGLIFLFP